jgi:hypothetical protein
MDSGSDEARDYRAAQRLLDALSSLLEDSLLDGLQTTCDIYISDRNGKLITRGGFSSGGDGAGKVMVVQEPAEGRPPSDAGQIPVGGFRK